MMNHVPVRKPAPAVPRQCSTAYTHAQAQKILLEGDALIKPDHFDPKVLEAFRAVHEDFATIHDRRAN